MLPCSPTLGRGAEKQHTPAALAPIPEEAHVQVAEQHNPRRECLLPTSTSQTCIRSPLSEMQIKMRTSFNARVEQQLLKF